MDKSKLNVLLVDDNANMRHTLRHMLNQLGFDQIVEAGDGEVALRHLAAQNFDLVVCDWNMPRLKGIDVLHAMRRTEKLRMTPFLMVTAEVQEDVVAQAAEGEVDAYIIKPFTAQTLHEKIEAILRRRFNPTELETLAQLAEVYRRARRVDQAVQAYNKILSKQPDYGPALHGLADIARERGDLTRAEELLEKAIAAHPKFARAYDALASLYETRGDEGKRLDALRKAAEIDPEAVGNSETIAEMFLDQGQYDEAVKMFEMALERDPSALNTYNRIGIAYRRQNRFDEAISLYDRALQAAPTSAMVMYNRGCCYLEWGKSPEARRAFEKALEFDPQFEEARKALDVLAATAESVA
ncbi:MAG: tetratricopeptide repeat protein [Candidatus Sumerlaeota bacterium]|nr:tetratricopeptide repeat protein [Candidatus Sumerlaeota bacterium]